MKRLFRWTWLALLTASPLAQAQSTRTWISGTGSDTNPCSRTAPCLTLEAALAKTASAGEINVLDSVDLGTAIITQSVNIHGHKSLATIAVSADAGLVIQAGPDDTVTVRDVEINGQGTGTSGIQFLSGRALHLENVAVSGFAQDGVDFAPTDGASLFVTGLEARSNGNAGLSIAGDSTFAMISSSRFRENAVGVFVGTGAKTTLMDSEASGNSGTGVLASGAVDVNLQHVTASHNSTGVSSQGSGATVRLSRSTVIDNVDVSATVSSGGKLLSFGDNRIVPLAQVTPISVDAGTARSDGGSVTNDGGSGSGSTPKKGCGCSTTDVPLLGLAALSLLVFTRRRRA